MTLLQLLLVEDDPYFAAWVGNALAPRFPALRVAHHATRAQALAQLALPDWTPSLAIVDLNLPDGSGIEVIAAVARLAPQAPVLVITAVEQPDIALAAMHTEREPEVPLTPRQCDVLKGIAQGHSSKEIARVMGVSLKTVAYHRAELIQRLDLHDVASLTRFAMRQGLLG